MTVDVKVVSAEPLHQQGKLAVQPGTITGSIGVIYGKLNIAGGLDKVGPSLHHLSMHTAAAMVLRPRFLLLRKFPAYALVQVGITTDIVAKGDNAAATSPFTDFTKQQLVQVHCRTTFARVQDMP